MNKKTPSPPELSTEEGQLIQQLRAHPELIAHFRTILEITAQAEGEIQRADEVEELLLQELRRLGNTTMASWACRAESTLGQRLQQRESSAGVRKKKR